MSSLKEKGSKRRKPLMKTMREQSDKKSVVSCKTLKPGQEWPTIPD